MSAGPIDPFGIGVDSFIRLDVVMQNRARMQRSAWLTQLGEVWSMCDNHARWRVVLRRILSSAPRADLDLLMTDVERDQLARLPKRIEIWRGCYAINREGLSWTTERGAADRFPTLIRYRRTNDRPLLLKGYAWRRHTILKLDRDEAEIIAPRVFGVMEEAIGGTA